MFNNLCNVLLRTTLCVSLVHAFGDYPTVVVNQGILKGKYMKSENGKSYGAFLSIPYAEPPVGDLRFQAPVPGQPWKGVRNAFINHPKCPQFDYFTVKKIYEGNEDCLYLNVFTPQLRSTQNSSYPVMIFIHGGGYYFGSALMHGADYLLDYEIILVTFNFRLGALGFLSTGDGEVPGNNGLKDQSLAIKWVYDNIRYFGGDPKQITLFGESSGASSTHLHYFSPLTKGLFKRGISQSGTVFCRWALGETHKVVKNSKTLAAVFNCSDKNHKHMVKCLQKVDAYELVRQSLMFLIWSIEPLIPFKPVIEVKHNGAFISEHPLVSMKSGRYANLPWITGVNTEEGAMMASAIFNQPQLIQELDQDFNKIMSIIFEDNTLKFDTIRKFYFGNKKINNSTRFEVVDLFSELMCTVCAEIGVNLHLKYSKQPVYYYLYGHKHQQSFSQIFGETHPLYGTCHSDELLSLFPVPNDFVNTETTPLDKRVSKMVTSMWTNFAKKGDPTPNLNTLIQTKWKPVKTKNLEYSYIGPNILSATNMFSNRIKFWTNFNISANYKRIIDELL